jgi:CheY-like chemotaxis protein
MKILIVEDDQISTIILRAYLAYILPSAEIIDKDNGKTAWQYLSNGNVVDLMLVDIKLPYMDGFEVLKRYREKKGKAIAIAITAMVYGHPPDAWKYFNKVLFKPFTKEGLKKEIERLL